MAQIDPDPEMDQPHAAPAGGSSDEKTMPLVIYVLHLLGFLTAISALVGLVLAYVYRSEAAPWVQSHLDNAITIFWVGLLSAIVLGIIAVVTLGIGSILYIGWAVWIIVRCVKGIVRLNEGKPYPNPSSWGF